MLTDPKPRSRNRRDAASTSLPAIHRGELSELSRSNFFEAPSQEFLARRTAAAAGRAGGSGGPSLAEINARNATNGAPELSARIGIDTGPVVVEATGEVFGDAPNVAAGYRVSPSQVQCSSP